MSFFDFLTRGRNTCDLLHAEEGAAARKYRHFKDFLHDNHRALSAVADLEGLYHQGAYSLPEARRHLNELLEATDNLLGDLDRLTGGRYPALHDVLARLNEETGVILSAATPAPCVPPVLSLADVTPDMASACGTKSTNLATMRNVLGIPTPPGFVVTARGFERFIEENALGERIAQALSRCAATARPGDDPVMLERVSAEIRDMVLHAPVPASLSDAILDAYRALEAATHPGVHVAMRSSAVGEDTEASFAGQYVTVLNVTAADILTAYREVLASKYSPRAIIIVVANPMDTLTYLALKASGLPKNRIIGMGGALDSARFKCYLAKATGANINNVDGMVIGGHGDTTMIPLVSKATVNGVPVSQFASKKKLEEAVANTMVGGATLTKLIGTSAWYAPGAGAAMMVEAILNDQKKMVPCCCYLDGEYGQKDICIGVPAIIGRKGIEKIVKIDLTKEEAEKFAASAEAVRKTNNILHEIKAL